MIDVVSVGHFTVDSISLPNRRKPFVVLGGSVAYASFAARRLNAAVSVVSKVGGDFPKAYLWWIEQEGINSSGIVRAKKAQTTRFELKYSNDLADRKLKLKSRAPDIAVGDLPNSLKSKVIHVAPVAGEIAYETVERLRGCADWLSLDLQGLVRSFDEQGNVSYGSLADKRVLDLANICKSSTSEIKSATGLSSLKPAVKAVHDCGVETVIVTLGAKGALLSVEESFYEIPACRSERTVDPTGAGDVFAGSFLAEYVRGKDLLRCACVGSAAASFVVEKAGPTFFGEESEIHRRADMLYEKEIKQ